MPNIPDKAVVGRVKHIVQGDRKLDDAEASAKMTAGFTNRIEQEFTQLACEYVELIDIELAQLFGFVDRIEQRRNWALCWYCV